MEAKDTVMSEEKIRKIYLDRAIERYGVEGGTQIISQLESVNNGQDIAEAQAELSFKAGYEQKCFETYEAGVKDGNQKGIREVVEWLHQDINREIHKGFEVVIFKALGEDWQAKLKEWGIDGI